MHCILKWMLSVSNYKKVQFFNKKKEYIEEKILHTSYESEILKYIRMYAYAARFNHKQKSCIRECTQIIASLGFNKNTPLLFTNSPNLPLNPCDGDFVLSLCTLSECNFFLEI